MVNDGNYTVGGGVVLFNDDDGNVFDAGKPTTQ